MSDDTPSQSSGNKPLRGLVVEVTTVGGVKRHEIKFLPGYSLTYAEVDDLLKAHNVRFEEINDPQADGSLNRIGTKLPSEYLNLFKRLGGKMIIPDFSKLEIEANDLSYRVNKILNKAELQWSTFLTTKAMKDYVMGEIEKELKELGIDYTKKDYAITIEGADSITVLACSGANLLRQTGEYIRKYEEWQDNRNITGGHGSDGVGSGQGRGGRG